MWLLITGKPPRAQGPSHTFGEGIPETAVLNGFGDVRAATQDCVVAADQTIANATVDRLLHHAHVVMTAGDSIRLTQATAGKGVTPLTN